MKTWISVALLAFVCFFQKGECAITDWTRPAIASAASGSAALVTKINNKVTTVSGLSVLAVSGTTGLTHALESQSPTTGATFAIDTAGAITITSGATDYSTNTEYILTVTADDAGGVKGTASTTLSINNNPAFSSHQFLYCIANSASADTTVATLTASTTTTSTGFTYAIASGDSNSHWTFDSSTAVLKTAVAMAADQYAGYLLTITATDGTLTGTSNVVIGVGCSSGATTVFAGCITLFMALMAHLY